MTRPRRPHTPDGKYQCTRCEEWKHISQFYQRTGAFISFRNPETRQDEWFGKPQSWCIDCMKAHRLEQIRQDKEREAALRPLMVPLTEEPEEEPQPSYVPERLGPPPGIWDEPTDEELAALTAPFPQVGDQDDLVE